MSLISDLVDRVGLLLQDSDHSAWTEDVKRLQVLDEISKLSRMGIFGEILWRNAVAGTAMYSLPETVVKVNAACYDGTVIREATERSLALKNTDWELRAARPQYYTQDLQSQTSVRVNPEPIISGSEIPEFPPLPMLWRIDKNLIFFTSDNPQTAGGLEQDCMVPDWIEDVIVIRAASKLSGDKGDYEDEEKSYMLDMIAGLFLSGMTNDLDLEATV